MVKSRPKQVDGFSFWQNVSSTSTIIHFYTCSTCLQQALPTVNITQCRSFTWSACPPHILSSSLVVWRLFFLSLFTICNRGRTSQYFSSPPSYGNSSNQHIYVWSIWDLLLSDGLLIFLQRPSTTLLILLEVHGKTRLIFVLYMLAEQVIIHPGTSHQRIMPLNF